LTESQLQAKILRYLENLTNTYVIKVVTANKSGVPDIIVSLNGRFVAIEVKTEKGVISKLQQYNIDKINKLGGTAFICRSYDEFLDKLFDIVLKKT